MSSADSFGARSALGSGEAVYRLDSVADPSRLPYTVCVLLENLVRRAGRQHVTDADVRALAGWPAPAEGAQLAFMPARVIMQDLTGVPAVVDLAAMRAAVARRGGDPSPGRPAGAGRPRRSTTRCRSTRSARRAPTSETSSASTSATASATRSCAGRRGRSGTSGSCRRGWASSTRSTSSTWAASCTVRDGVALPDTLVGTDSHTTMINALGVLGWGVGGIEAEAVDARPADLHAAAAGRRRPARGRAARGVTATDLVLTLTELLRKHGVVGQVRRVLRPRPRPRSPSPTARRSRTCRPSTARPPPRSRSTRETLRYLRDTGRAAEPSTWSSATPRSRGCSAPGRSPTPAYTETLDFDLSAVEPSLAGPRRPQDRVLAAPQVARQLRRRVRRRARRTARRPGRRLGRHRGHHVVHQHVEPGAHGGRRPARARRRSSAASRRAVGEDEPRAGLARRDRVPAPGRADSRSSARLQPGRLRLHDLHRELRPAARRGRRRDRARRPEGGGRALGQPQLRGPHPPAVRANYLASPPLVVAYALAGTVNVDLTTEPLGEGTRRARLPARHLADAPTR